MTPPQHPTPRPRRKKPQKEIFGNERFYRVDTEVAGQALLLVDGGEVGLNVPMSGYDSAPEESPNSKRVREQLQCLVETQSNDGVDLTKPTVKRFDRPVSGGQDTSTGQFQMQAPSYRQTQSKTTRIPKPQPLAQWGEEENQVSTQAPRSPRANEEAHSSIASFSLAPMTLSTKAVFEDPDETLTLEQSTEKEIQSEDAAVQTHTSQGSEEIRSQLAIQEGHLASSAPKAPEGTMESGDDAKIGDNSSLPVHKRKAKTPSPRTKSPVEPRVPRRIHAEFDMPNEEQQAHEHLEIEFSDITEEDGVFADDTLVDIEHPQVELTEQHWPHSEPTSVQPLTARSPRMSTNVVRPSKVLKPAVRPIVRVQPTNRSVQKPQSAASVQPTEEDMLFLLMSRSRRRNDRESRLLSEKKQLETHNAQLQEDNRICQEQLDAASFHCEKQASEIKNFKAEVNEFKLRFTKFKAYAKGLANDHASLGTALKQFKETQETVLQDQIEIGRSLESLKQESTKAVEEFRNMKPEISSLYREVEPLHSSLQLAESSLRKNEVFLKHERLRNDRIESQILYNHRIQQRQNLSVAQSCRGAASFLDEMCKAIVAVGKILGKKPALVDSPGIGQCLALLQALTEKGDFGSATSAEIKSMFGIVSERLLKYHNAINEAAKIAANHGEQFGKDVLNQVTESLDSVGTAVATQTEFISLREKATRFETALEVKEQLFDRVNESRIRSEDREKEISKYVGQLIEQLGKVQAVEAPVEARIASRASPDQTSMLLNKWMHQNKELVEEQQKVKTKEDLIQRQEEMLVKLGEQLKAVQFKQRTSHSENQMAQEKLQAAESKHALELASARGEAENALQQHIEAQNQIRKLEDQLQTFTQASREAARVPELVQSLKSKTAQATKLQQEADELPRLTELVEAKSKEVEILRKETAKLTTLTKNVESQSTQITQLKMQADRLPELVQSLDAKCAEIERLQTENSQLPKLTQLLETASAQVVELEQNVPQLQSLRAHGLALQLDLKKRDEVVIALETQLRDAKEKASLIDGMQQAAEEFANSIQQLEGKVSDYDQLDSAFAAQGETLSVQSAEINKLKAKLEKAVELSSNVQSLQAETEEWADRFHRLDTQLELARKKAETIQSLEDELGEKNSELAILKGKLENVEQVAAQINSVQEESQMKTNQLESLREQLLKLQVDSQQLAEIRERQSHFETSPQSILDFEHNPKRIMPAGTNMLRSPAITFDRRSHTFSQNPRRKKADRASAGLNVLRMTGVPSTAIEDMQRVPASATETTAVAEVDETQRVPDSQPQTAVVSDQTRRHPSEDVDTFLSLNQTENTHPQRKIAAKFSANGTQRSINPNPPSSYGGDSMLLEDFEAVEGQGNAPLTPSSKTQEKPRVSQQDDQQGHRSSKPSSGTITLGEEDDPNPRRLRSGLSQSLDYTPMLEHSSSSPNILPSSPGAASHGKQLANSAAKRRLDPLENEQNIGEGSSKRLKRTPSNLEVRKPSKTPMNSNAQASDPDTGRTNRTSMPSGSRTGSVIGVNAPLPGRAQSTKKQARKGSKNRRYSARFSQE